MGLSTPFGTGKLLATLLLSVSAISYTGIANADDGKIGPLPKLKIDKAKAELGKRLFFDPRLSGDAAISCGSCHQPEHGFAHPDKLSPGYPGNGHFRNVPTLINTAHKTVWNHDGRIGTNLNDVTRGMITETYLMNMDMRLMQERVKQDPVYVQMFKDAGYGEPSNGKVRKAIPEYLKTLTSVGAPFDTGKMSDDAKKGQKLFTGKAACVNCHNGTNFTDNKAYNTGVPENFDIFLDPMNHQAFIGYAMFMGIENYMNLKRDPGAHIQHHEADGSSMGLFQTPTLRELNYTAPYMHNGMLPSLAAVVDFYNNGGGQDSNKDKRLKKLHLTKNEKKQLVAFLKSLSGKPLTSTKYVVKEEYPTEYDVIENWRETSN